jgi:hypothetical protein
MGILKSGEARQRKKEMSDTPLRTLDTSLPATLAAIEADPLAIIRAVMCRVPDLSSNGFRAPRVPGAATFDTYRDEMTTPDCVAEFIRAAQFIAQHPRCSGPGRISSYGWKHAAERWHMRRNDQDRGASYISNGMFLAAAYAMGCKVKQERASPNGKINLVGKMPWQ